MKENATSVFLLLVGALLFVAAITQQPTLAYVRPNTPPVLLSPEQQAWLGALEWCESSGNPRAVNPKDSDGTPSYGLLQFKPGTFTYFSKMYGLPTTTSYMDPSQQKAIVTQMIVRGGVDFHQQFPACTRRLGTPPTN